MKILKNRTIIGVVCILLSIVICFVITPLFNSAVSEKISVVRVKNNILTGDEITADMLEVVEVGGYNLHENVIHSVDTIVGTYALADFAVGDYILNNKVSATKQVENAYLYNLDGTKQAMSVSIKSFANGLSGKIQSGDIVSVLAPNYSGLAQTVIPPELKYVEVISVTANSGEDANNSENAPENEDEELELPATITLLVTAEQSKILAGLEHDGDIHIALVYRGGAEKCEVFIAKQAEILTEIYPSQVESEDSNDILAEANEIIGDTEGVDEILGNGGQ